MESILVTGASGFIGSFIIEEALARGLEVWAAVRKSSSRAFLTDSRIHFIELTLSDPDALRKELDGKRFDYVTPDAPDAEHDDTGMRKCVERVIAQ